MRERRASDPGKRSAGSSGPLHTGRSFRFLPTSVLRTPGSVLNTLLISDVTMRPCYFGQLIDAALHCSKKSGRVEDDSHFSFTTQNCSIKFLKIGRWTLMTATSFSTSAIMSQTYFSRSHFPTLKPWPRSFMCAARSFSARIYPARCVPPRPRFFCRAPPPSPSAPPCGAFEAQKRRTLFPQPLI